MNLFYGATVFYEFNIRAVNLRSKLTISKNCHKNFRCLQRNFEIIKISTESNRFKLYRGAAEFKRWQGAKQTGDPDPFKPESIAETASQTWGLAARGAVIEDGTPEFDFQLTKKSQVWADEAVRLYAQAVSAQWDPNTAIPWNTKFELQTEVEDAVVQLMTYLII